jgi:hypothetical protein
MGKATTMVGLTAPPKGLQASDGEFLKQARHFL